MRLLDSLRRQNFPSVLAFVLIAVLAAGVGGHRLMSARRTSDAPAVVQRVEASSDEADEPDVTQDSDIVTLDSYDCSVYTNLGEPVLLSQIADGKPLVINFWATWCPYCVAELPDFAQIVADYDGRVSFAFVDVCDGEHETEDVAKAWLADNGFESLPEYYDRTLEATVNFGARALPTTVVVSAEGEVLGVSAGQIDPGRMRETLDGLV